MELKAGGTFTNALGTLAHGLVVSLIILLLALIASDHVPGIWQDAESG